VPHRVEGERGPGERAVGLTGRLALGRDGDLRGAEGRGAGWEPGARRCIGHEHHALARGREHKPDDVVGDVLAVADETEPVAGIGQGGARHTGLAMVDAALRVEQVGDERGSGVRRGVDDVGGGVTVPHRHHDTRRHESSDRVERARELQGQRHDRERRVEAEQVRHGVPRRVVQPLEPVCAGTRGREERPLDVDARTRAPPTLSSTCAPQEATCASRSSSGAVRRVGTNAVTPVVSSARRASSRACGVALVKSTPKQPLTCRSTRPAVSSPLPGRRGPRGTPTPVRRRR